MKKIVFTTLFLVGALLTNAQYNSLGLYNPHFTFNKAEFIPSKLGTNKSRVEFRALPNAFVYAGNSLMPINDILYPTTSGIDKAINEANNSSRFGAAGEIPFLAISYRVGKTKELMTFSFSNKTRVLANTVLGDNLLKLIWNGNKQFEGQTVDLGKFRANSFAATQINLGWAMPIEIGSKTLRIGSNLKYLLGVAGASISETTPKLTTETGGKSVAFSNLDYRADMADPDENNTFLGSGFAIDLSATYSFTDEINASLAILDIGSIGFSENTKSYSGNGNFTFEGLVIDNIFNDYTIDLDSVLRADVNTEGDSHQTFSVGLPTRLVAHVEKNITNGEAYTKHGIYLTYIQGFNNNAGTTTKPYFAAGYSYSLNDILNVGSTANYGGYSGFGLGMFMSVKAGPFRIGAGSNSGLSYLLFPRSAKSVDFSFMTTWSIGKGTTKISAPSIN